MAVTRLADVFPAHVRRVIIFAVSLQLILLGLLAVLLWGAGIDVTTMVVYILLPVTVMQFFAFITVGKYALEPLDFLARTVLHVSSQPHDTAPPNLNGTRHERTGFKLMVDTIYGLAIHGSPAQSPATGVTGVQAAILDNAPAGVFALNEKRAIIYKNELAPIVKDDKNQDQIQLMFDGTNTLENWLSLVEQHEVTAHKTWTRVQTAIPGEPGRRVFDITASYQKNGAGGADTLVVLLDQTARYAVNEEAMDFIALAAHELRGPITVIRGYLDVLKPELEAVLNDDQRQLFDRLEVSSGRLSGYVSNILNASKYDRRHLRLHLHEDKLADIYALVADDLALRASSQGRLLSVNLPTDLPAVAADRNSLSEVITNLVDNAIKYSRDGGQVNVSAGVDGDMVKFDVQDFGVGIPGSVVGNLFTKFYRSHRSKDNVSGTGLGLYISKAIIESHGGHINLTSTEGQGSTFSFTVPVYSTVADKLLAENAGNQGIMEVSNGWIKNHSMYRG